MTRPSSITIVTVLTTAGFFLMPLTVGRAASGLTAGYAFSEGVGTTTADASGAGLTGTLINAPVWTAGRNGSGLSFNGSSTYVDLGNPAALQITGSLTLSAWVYERANVADDGQIIAKSDGGSGFQLKSSPDTGVRAFAITISDPSGVQIQRNSQTVRALNTWYHISGVFNAVARTLDIYVNGVLNNGVLSGTVPTAIRNASVNANIGRRTGGFYINGLLDDVRVYNRALTAMEIQSDMNTPVGGTAGFDFSLTAGALSIVRGASAPNGVSASLISGTPTSVSFSASGLPTGATASFSPASCVLPCSTTMTVSTTSSTPIGTSTVTVTGVGAGIPRATTFQLTVSTAGDVSAPTISMTAPAANAIVAGTAVTVSANASDDVGVVGVQFLLDGANLGTEDTVAPYSISWNTTTTVSGNHTISARARDGSGKSTTATGIAVVVDNQPPTGSVVINGGAAATNNRNVTLTLAATDAFSTVTQMRFSNTNGSFSTAETFGSTKAWTLSTGTGTKTVYAQFKDALGNWSAAITDTIVVDTTAPTISAVASSSITNNAATVAWTTNETATSRVEYGTTNAYGQSTVLDPSLVTGHSVPLTGLASQTTYNYRVRSIDQAGNERVGSNATLRTLAGPDTTPPSAPVLQPAVFASATQLQLSWTASTDNVAVTGYDVYRDGTLIGSVGGTSYTDPTLVRLATYAYTVHARDATQNNSLPSNAITVTAPALIVTGIAVSAITSTSATISWTTDVPGTTEVDYGTTSAYGSSTTEIPALTMAHSQTLTGLTADTTYHFAAVSADAGDHHVVSADNVFATSPAGQSGVFQNEILISGMNLPTAVKFLPNGDMLILELGGKIWKVPAGTTQVNPTPVLTLTNIGTQNGQQGLMDLAFDPSFTANHYYYVFYTLGSPNRDRVSRFTFNADFSGTVAASEFVLYQDPEAANAEHHGGALNFAADGKLLVTTGEHFNADEAQMLTVPRGKVLRFNSDGTVPTDNPFYDGNGPNVDAIWALGLRNPFRASYDPVTDRLYIGDVGGNDYSTAREELNVGARGANYGWPNCEGTSCGSNPAYTSPLFDYGHNGRDAAITGGFVYRGSQFPATYYGNYFYADYAQNWIRRLTLDANGNVTGNLPFEPADGSPDGPTGDIVHLTQAPDGSLIYVDLGYSDTTGQTGVSKIRRIRFISSDQPPTAVAAAQPVEGPPPLDVSFSSDGSIDPEAQSLTYDWDFGDGATSTAANPAHTYASAGRYVVRLSVSDGTSTSLADPIVVSVGNRPTPVITSPRSGLFFNAGEVISFVGEGTDLDDGTLAPQAFTWNIDFLHAGHVHPGLPQTGTTSGTFTIPTSGHDFSGDTRYRITLTVTDSNGLQNSTSVFIYPRKVNLTFDAVPSGVAITLDGIPHATPFVYDTLIGFVHTVEASNQTIGPNVYTFSAWSDGGAQTHALTVPSVDASFRATYTLTQNPPPPGLVAGYRFSEGTGSTTADISGTMNTGTLSGSPLWETGKYGGGLTFQGANFVNIGNGSTLQLTGGMTLTAWIKITANPFDDASIVTKFGSGGWQLKTSPDTGQRTAAIQVGSNSSDSIQRYSSTILALNTWYHIAGVYDAAARTLSIYVNGAIDNGVLLGTVPAAQYNPPVNVNIGQRTSNPGTFNFIGTLDEVHVFNRALTATEIVIDMNTPR